MKDIIFTRGEIEPMQGEIEMNIGKLGNSKKVKFPFWMEGTFGDDIWLGGSRRSRLGGDGVRRNNGSEPDGTGILGQECQMAEEGGDGRGQEGQMVGVVGQDAGGREPYGAEAVGQGGPDGQEGGDGRVHEGQIAVFGGSRGNMEQEFKMVGRQGPDLGVRFS